MLASQDYSPYIPDTRAPPLVMHGASTPPTVAQPSSPAPARPGNVSLCVSFTTVHTGVSGRQANQRAPERCHVGRPERRTRTVPMRVAHQRGTPAWARDEGRRWPTVPVAGLTLEGTILL